MANRKHAHWCAFLPCTHLLPIWAIVLCKLYLPKQDKFSFDQETPKASLTASIVRKPPSNVLRFRFCFSWEKKQSLYSLLSTLLLMYSVAEIIYSYCFVLRLYNGDTLWAQEEVYQVAWPVAYILRMQIMVILGSQNKIILGSDRSICCAGAWSRAYMYF